MFDVYLSMKNENQNSRLYQSWISHHNVKPWTRNIRIGEYK